MRIGLVVPGGVDRSGRERVIPALLALIERLARRHEVVVFALAQERSFSRYTLLGADVINLGTAGTGVPAVRPVLQWLRLSKALAEETGGLDVMHAFWAGRPSTLAWWAARRDRTPILVSLAGGEMVSLPDIGYGGRRSWVTRREVGSALRRAAAVTAGSDYARRLAQALRSDIRHVPLGVDRATFLGPHARPSGPPWRLITVSSINRVKDPRTLLEAFSLVTRQEPACRLDWIGEDTLEGAAVGMAASLGLGDRVRFHGFKPQPGLVAHYRQAHLYLQASRHESQGVSVCEAAMAGVPTVGTDVGLVAELAPDAACSVPVQNAKRLAASALALLRDTRGREAMGLAAQRWAKAHDSDHTAGVFESIYEELAAKAQD